jgi:hypothetical protein
MVRPTTAACLQPLHLSALTGCLHVQAKLQVVAQFNARAQDARDALQKVTPRMRCLALLAVSAPVLKHIDHPGSCCMADTASLKA